MVLFLLGEVTRADLFESNNSTPQIGVPCSFATYGENTKIQLIAFTFSSPLSVVDFLVVEQSSDRRMELKAADFCKLNTFVAR